MHTSQAAAALQRSLSSQGAANRPGTIAARALLSTAHVDERIRLSALPAAQMAAKLLNLERDGALTRGAGGVGVRG